MGMIGKTFSHYRVVGRIGGGGMGVVYKAEDIKLGRSVALKFLPPQLVDDPEAKERFIKEAKAASALDHPNICTVYEIGETDDEQLFLAMAHYEGETLKRRLERGPMAVDEAVDIIRQMAEGLAKSHLCDIVHRDIKPPNIFLTPDNQVKILDFGLAKVVGDGGMTLSGLTQGTPAYMAPELIRGESANPSSDLWSVGVVFYEALGGQRPFGGKSVPAVVHSIHTEEPRSLQTLRPEIPQRLEEVVGRLLHKDARKRYGSCRELLEDLDHVAHGRVSPIWRAEEASRPGSEAIASSVGMDKDSEAVTDSTFPIGGPQRHRRSGAPWWAAAVLALIGLVVAGIFLFPGKPRSSLDAEVVNTDRPTSLAVLFFDNASGDPEIEWLRTALPEMLVTDLSQSSHISVYSTNQIYQLLSEFDPLSAETFAFTLVEPLFTRASIDRVVLGTILKVDDTLRVEVKIQGEDGEILETLREERLGEESIFALTDELSRRIRQRIEIGRSLETIADQNVEDLTTDSVEALRAYNEGLEAHFRYDERLAYERFQKSLEIDPDLTLAWAKLAIVASNLGRPAEAIEAAQEALLNAERLSAAERHYIAGFVAGHDTREWSKAVTELGRAVEVEPEHQAARIGLAMLQGVLERHAEAVRHAEKLLRHGYYPAAQAVAAQIYAQVGRLDDAKLLLEEFDRDRPGFLTDTAFGWYHLRAGDLAASRARFTAADAQRSGAVQSFMGLCAVDLLREEWQDLGNAIRDQMTSVEPADQMAGVSCRVFMAQYLGQPAEAAAMVSEAVGRIPVPRFRALFEVRLSHLHLELGQLEEALAVALRAREDGRGSFAENRALFAAGLASLAMDRIEEAQGFAEMLERLAELLPSDKEHRRVRHLRGEIALREGDLERAVAELEAAEQTLPSRGIWTVFDDPPHASLWWSLAKAYHASGERERAVRVLKELVESGEERVFDPASYLRARALLAELDP